MPDLSRLKFYTTDHDFQLPNNLVGFQMRQNFFALDHETPVIFEAIDVPTVCGKRSRKPDWLPVGVNVFDLNKAMIASDRGAPHAVEEVAGILQCAVVQM